MPGPARKAGTPSKKGSKSSVTLLKAVEGAEIPPLPRAEDFISFPGGDPARHGGNDSDYETVEPQWNRAVEDWWDSIWSSPMSGEFVESDIHSLYLACMYLHESLNPFNKPAERAGFGKNFEATIKNFGLTPSARETLRWQVAQGTAAQSRTDMLRSKASSETVRETGKVTDLYANFGNRKA